MGRGREDHAHAERIARSLQAFCQRLQDSCRNRVLWAAKFVARNCVSDLCPDIVGNCDAVAVQVHGKWRHEVGLHANSDPSGQWLTSQHMGPVKASIGNAFGHGGPVRHRLKSDVETFVGEVAFLECHSQRGHVSELDEAKGEIRLLNLGVCNCRGRNCGSGGEYYFLHFWAFECCCKEEHSYAELMRPKKRVIWGEIAANERRIQTLKHAETSMFLGFSGPKADVKGKCQ